MSDFYTLKAPIYLNLSMCSYHHIGNRVAYCAKLNSSLKADGCLLLVDFRMDSPDKLPKEHHLSIKKVSKELKSVGYKLTKSDDFYFIVFQKIAK